MSAEAKISSPTDGSEISIPLFGCEIERIARDVEGGALAVDSNLSESYKCVEWLLRLNRFQLEIELSRFTIISIGEAEHAFWKQKMQALKGKLYSMLVAAGINPDEIDSQSPHLKN